MIKILIFILGFIIGSLFIAAGFVKKISGTLVIDKSDPFDDPMLFLELKKNVSFLEKNQYIMFEVEKRNYLSQE